ncbi:MAG: dihydroneopterin aldolase [Lysobacteraceae bacterium]
MSDRVFIEGLRVDALVGVYEHERHGRQPLRVDLELGYDNRVPAASDDLADTLDYAEVCAAVRDLAASRGDQLLEVMAEAIAELLMRRFGAAWVRVRIDKPEAARALGCDHVGVCIVRGRDAA